MRQHFFYRMILSLLLLTLIAGMSFVPMTVSASSPAVEDLRILSSDLTGLVVELTVPALTFEPSESDQGTCLHARVPGWGSTGSAGEPSLPVRGTLIGLPTDQSPRIEVLNADQVTLQQGINLCPAPTRQAVQSLDGSLNNGGEVLLVDKEVYNTKNDLPGALVEISAPERVRGQSVVRLSLQPFQYNPSARTLLSYAHLKVRITFSSPATIEQQSSALKDSLFGGLLLNETQSSNWRSFSMPNMQVDNNAFTLPTGPSVKIAVSKDGLVQVDYAALAAASAPVEEMDPISFHITSSAGESDLTVEDDGDSVFETGERIIFYGQKVNTHYTDTNIYWLTWGENNGPRIQEVNAAPSSGSMPMNFMASATFEKNILYLSKYPSGADQEHWYWDYVYATSSTSKEFPASLTHVASSGGTGTIRGLLKGYAASSQHHTKIYINNTLIREDYWPAQSELAFTSTFPQSLLHEGSNNIKVECPLTGGATLDVPLINWLKIDYEKTYAAEDPWTQFNIDTAGDWRPVLTGLSSSNTSIWDITDPLHPMNLTNPTILPDGATYTLAFQQSITATHRYLAGDPSLISNSDQLTMVAPVDLRAPSNAADYIVITHPDFLKAVLPLANFHAAQQMRVKVINVQDVYNNFSGGVIDPLAIHDFIAYAYANWQRPAPAYVLLVGDGNYDPKNYLGFNEPNYVPPYLAMADPWLGEVAADNQYVAVDGTDSLPDLALGRLPVKTASEATAVVDKILSYSSNSGSGDWSRSFLLVADEPDPSAGDFPAISDKLALDWLTPRGLSVDKIYYTITHTTAEATRQAILGSINDEKGKGVVVYNGHSSQFGWGADALFMKASVESLTNSNQLPFFISLTCYTGYYIYPPINHNEMSSLDEVLLRASGKGASATFSPTGEGTTAGHDILVRGLLDALFNHTTLIGPATTSAKITLFGASGLYNELIDTFELFGDPAMRYPVKPTAVNLNYFQASAASGGVQLSWETVSEGNIVGFNLYRHRLGDDFTQVNSYLIPAQFSGQFQSHVYTYLDTDAVPGTLYEYRLDVIENSLQVLQSSTTLYWPFAVQLPVIRN